MRVIFPPPEASAHSHRMKPMDISLVIPAYNEEHRLGATLDRLAEFFGALDRSAEVIVVDDGSTDDTARIAESKAGLFKHFRLIRNGGNRGKGYSVRNGMTQARGDIRLFYDADSSTPIEELHKVLPRIEEGFDIVIGSRSLPDSDVQVRQKWYREYLGKLFNVLVKLFALRGFIDTQCGFKCFTARATKVVFPRQTLWGFGFDVELLFIARKHGLRAIEIPVRWINSPSSRLNPVTDSLRMLAELMTIRIKDLLGRYR